MYFADGNPDFYRGVYSFSCSLDLDRQYLEGLSDPAIVVPAVSGNGIRLRVNGEVLGYHGDLNDGNASVWNLPYVFFIPEQLLERNNEISIELYSLYEVGINRIPYLIDAGSRNFPKVMLLVWMESGMHFLIGGLTILGIVFFLTGILTAAADKQKIFLGLALFLISVFLLDYSYLDHTVVSYLSFKKTVIISQFLALMFFILYIADTVEMLKSKFVLLFSIFLICLAVTALLFPGDMVSFRKFYRYAYSANLLLFGFLIFLFISRIKRTVEMTTIFAGGFTALIFSIHDMICLSIDRRPGFHVALRDLGSFFKRCGCDGESDNRKLY